MITNLKFFLPRLRTGAAMVTGFSMLIVLAFCSLADAQKFDIEDYLKKKDNNRNGKIEENEMSDNTKGILKKMGFDVSKSVSISKIVAKVNKDKKAIAAGKKPGNSETAGRTRQVPGFGVEATESVAVARFDSAESSSAGKPAKFSESVMERVATTLEKYDRNKDGSLDESEIKRARWGSPPPGENDTNKDGRLSRKELANRYADRERYYRIEQAKKSEGSQDKDKKKEAEKQEKLKRDRERFRASGTSYATSQASPTYSRNSSSTSSGPSAAASQAKYRKYADSLISNYDKDKDGKLNKDEIKQMRRPPVGADTNKDGFITQSELLDSLSGANKATASSAKSEQKADKASSKYARKDSTAKSTRASTARSGSSSSFDNLDSDSDRLVQMHEFSDEWDDDLVAEFYEKDKNGDGVITLGEWSARN